MTLLEEKHFVQLSRTSHLIKWFHDSYQQRRARCIVPLLSSYFLYKMTQVSHCV